MGGHAIINDDVMVFSIAPDMGTVATVHVGLLILDHFRQEIAFSLTIAEEVENRGQIAELDVKLNEIGNISLLFFGENAGAVGFEVEKNGQSE